MANTPSLNASIRPLLLSATNDVLPHQSGEVVAGCTPPAGS